MVERMVGPVLRGTDQYKIDSVVEAIVMDNPGKEVIVDDEGGYVRVSCATRCRLTRKSLEISLGEPFELSDLEPMLSGFAGHISYLSDDEVSWYLEGEKL